MQRCQLQVTNFNILEDSFDMSDGERPEEATEPSFDAHGEPAEDSILDDQPTTYEVLAKGTTRGKPLLVSSDGYTYTVKRTNKSTTIWTCSIRSKNIRCYASIVAKGTQFNRGPQEHVHPPEPRKTAKAKVTMKAKQVAEDNLFRASMTIVESTITEELEAQHRFLAPKRSNLKRVVNLYRARRRPEEPADLAFVLNREFLQCDDFILADITSDGQRHLVFASPFQLRILRQAKQCIIRFSSIINVFQLTSIHDFVIIDGKKKQFPLVFVLMSCRRKSDYVRVLTAIRDRLGDCQVEQCMLDFEQAAWQAIREVLPGVTLRGCIFHLTQELWRHIQELGLSRTYRERGATHNFIWMILALPFLPSHQIRPTFDAFRARCPAEPGHPLSQFVEYVRSQWIDSATFPPTTWSAFESSVRTNNDVEGWHNRLNRKTDNHPAMYVLIPLLQKEAAAVEAQIVSEDIERDNRRAYTAIEKKLRGATEKYMNNTLSTTGFLKAVAAVYVCGRDM
ncbi:uncharacterized protein LOC117332171 [Pecten maximus]|uniref:uncharacterized protein LOC117332171 n=1 Tax=Pecten maximus TaxID=6579 RepID=UPI001458BE21|nr:uncharacterized protein LOC117332171 [Pecten maximus]